jgi:HNH endonuclease
MSKKEHPQIKGYLFSDCGQVIGPSGRIRKLQTNHGGYYVILLRGKSYRISRLILETFVGPGKGLEAAHLDGNKRNNHISNLKWVTPSENNRHKVLHGTAQRGENATCVKLTEEQALTILHDVPTVERRRYYAQKFGVNILTVKDIQVGKTWKYLHEKT